jgi:RHS repeat-associated protein
MEGELLAEIQGNVPTSWATKYLGQDHLGTTRLVMNASGSGDGVVSSRHDYYPFGEELPGRGMNYGDPLLLVKYTGHERDVETELDFMQARYYGGRSGRFLSADGPLVDQEVGDPQSWNLYSYVRNSPLIFADPTGNDCVYLNGSGTAVDGVNNQINSNQCGNTGGFWVDGTVTDARFAHGSLILSGTTDGLDRTQSSFALGPDPGLLALQRGARATARVVNTLAAVTLSFVAGAGIVATVPGAVVSPAFIPEIFNFAGKQAARAALQNMGLPAAQAAAAIAAVARATSTSSIQVMRQGQNLIVQISRTGRNGYQVIESVIDQAGGKQVVQKAYDAAHTLVHFDPKK